MNKELKVALETLEKEKNVNKQEMLNAIQTSLENAYKNCLIRQSHQKGDDYFAEFIQKSSTYIQVVIDPESYDYEVFLAKEVIEDELEITNELVEIKLKDAREIDEECQIGDTVYVEAPYISLGHIAIQNSKGLIIQKLREQEKYSIFNEFKSKEHTVVTGIVGRRLKNAVNIDLGKADALMFDVDAIKGERLEMNERVKVYVTEVQESAKGPKIKVSRNCPELVYKLFESEVTEISDGTVIIKSLAREAGSRSKMAVYSNDPNVDAVGSCLGVNSIRVNAVVDELKGEKIDIVPWSNNINELVDNALSPAKTIVIAANEDEKEATVIVPDSQLSLAIGKDGQNARLAAKLTGYRIDIKSETQAVEQGYYDKYGLEYDHSKFSVDTNKQEENPTNENANVENQEVKNDIVKDEVNIENTEGTSTSEA